MSKSNKKFIKVIDEKGSFTTSFLVAMGCYTIVLIAIFVAYLEPTLQYRWGVVGLFAIVGLASTMQLFFRAERFREAIVEERYNYVYGDKDPSGIPNEHIEAIDSLLNVSGIGKESEHEEDDDNE